MVGFDRLWQPSKGCSGVQQDCHPIRLTGINAVNRHAADCQQFDSAQRLVSVEAVILFAHLVVIADHHLHGFD